MTILSDNTIKKLCTPPYRDFRKGTYVKECFNDRGEIYDVEWVDRSSLGGNATTTHDIRIDQVYEINNQGHPMIEPFVANLVRVNVVGEKIISYGLTSYGYDVRLSADGVKIFTNANGGIIDPMAPDEANFVDATIHSADGGHKFFILPPNSYALAATIEYFHIPRNVSVTCVGKSTYARSAVQINTTPIEAGFEGEVVIEIANSSTLPVKVYLETGIAQFMFFHGDKPCDISYADGNRKYQGQRGVTLSRI